MRTLAIALSLLLLAACEKASVIELEPKEHTFKRVGEDVWWHAKARTRQGKYLHKFTVAWKSSDPKVVTIDEKGRAKAIGMGHATLSAQGEGLTAEAQVDVLGVGKVVVGPAEGLTLDARGDAKPITIEVLDPAGHPMTDRQPVARCQNEDVCRVFADGVRGVDSGETKLIVTCEGAEAQIPIKVLPTEEERRAKGIDVDGPKKPAKRK